MRIKIAAAAVIAAALVGQTVAVAQPPSAKQTAADKAQAEHDQSMADKVIRGETLPPSDVLVQTPPPSGPSPAALMERAMAEHRQEAILRGDRGPFVQLTTAYRLKNWVAFGWASATISFWAAVAGLGIWLLAHLIGAIRRHGGA
jgi:hypothetical protein